MIDGGKFPALAPNAFELPYAVRPRGASLYLTAIVSAVILLAGLAFAAFFVLAPGKPDVGRYIALLGPGVIALIFGRQLWLLYRPAVTLYADRIERRGLFGAPRVLHRNEIKGVGPDISTRYSAYFEVLSLLDGGPIRLPSSARKDPWWRHG